MPHEFIEHLLEDHEKQRKMGEQIRNAKSVEERRKLWKELYNELSEHLLGEEASIFTYMTEAGGEARTAAQKALQEHHVAKLLIRELNDRNIDSDVWAAKAYVLDEINRHHLEEEEQKHFPMLERMASPEKISELYERYEKTEESEPKI